MMETVIQLGSIGRCRMTEFVKTIDRWIIFRPSKLDTGSPYFVV